MIEHVSLSVSSYDLAKGFYVKVLNALGYELVMDFPERKVACFGSGPKPYFIIHEGGKQTPKCHVAFSAATRELVDKFYDVALKAGGIDNGQPGIREKYHPNYYAAFVFDIDGHNIEAVCHQ